jgi:hypothetical protein
MPTRPVPVDEAMRQPARGDRWEAEYEAFVREQELELGTETLRHRPSKHRRQ